MSGQAERARRVLASGVVVFRWAALAWMGGLALSAGGYRRAWLAWLALGAAAAWTLWVTRPGRELPGTALALELVLAFALNVVSGFVVPDGAVIGDRPFFATGWPVSAAIAWGVARGPWAGAFAGVVLGAGLFLSRIANGIAPADITGAQWQSLASGIITSVLAGAAVGLVARLFERSAAELEAAQEETLRARERAARYAERESLARQIHDSVLQALALIHKRGREMGARDAVPGAEVAALGEAAAEQEAELRALILREPEDAPSGHASLRGALEQTGRRISRIQVSVSCVGPIWVPAHHATEIAAAVKQALDNVAEHAGIARAAVFAEQEGSWVTVSVRDEGRGFTYDEAALRADGKAGMLRSMKGRVESLGGRMSVRAAPMKGCEVEFLVPVGEPQ